MIPIHHVPHIGDFYRICGAIINKYHPTIGMRGADVAQTLLEQAREPNVIQALVEVDRLDTRNAQRWVNLDAAELRDFPELTIENLQNITIGPYQIKLSRSYVQDKLQRDANKEYHIEMLSS